MFELQFDAGVEQRAEPHLPGTEELIVLHPRAHARRAGRRPGRAGAGDAVWFAADVPHGYAGVRDARALCWMLYPAGPLR